MATNEAEGSVVVHSPGVRSGSPSIIGVASAVQCVVVPVYGVYRCT